MKSLVLRLLVYKRATPTNTLPTPLSDMLLWIFEVFLANYGNLKSVRLVASKSDVIRPGSSCTPVCVDVL